MGYVVTAPLVGVNGEDGKLKMLYQGVPVPADVSDEDIERLAEGGLIKKVGGDEPTAAEKRAAAAAAAKAEKEAAEAKAKAAAGAKA